MSGEQSGQVLGLSLILQLQQRIRTSHTLDEAAFIAVNESKQLLQYRQAVLWLSGSGVVALSGLPLPDRNSPYLNWLTELFPALLCPTMPTPIAVSALPSAVASDWQEWLPANALSVPLFRPDGNFFGILLLAREDAWQEGELALAAELGSIFSHGLTLHQRKIPLRDKLRSTGKSLYVKIGLAAALLLGLLIPVHLSVLAPAEVTAKDPFLVRAPLDGVIEQFYISPNQAVIAGQVLFSMDKTGLRSREGMARKSYEVAAEEYRQASVLALQDDRGKIEMAPRRGRMEEREADLSGTGKLLQRMEAVSPRDGIAIFSDPTDWVGKGVTLGEKVLLIADPQKAELLIRLPVADAIALEPGTRITLYLTNDPQHPHEARLTTAAFRAEVMPGGQVGYRLKADFINSSNLPRIGLSGIAKIYGMKVSLGYAIFRRPLTAVRQRLGW
jgi:hypothetical protein